MAKTNLNKIFDDGIKQLTTTVPEEMRQISHKTIDEVTEVCDEAQLDDEYKEKSETEMNIKETVLDIKISSIKAVKDIKQAGQHQVDIIESQLASRTDFKETECSEHKFKLRDEIPEDTHVEQKGYGETSEEETDVVDEKVPITVLGITAKCNLPRGMSQKELKEIIVDSIILHTMKQKTESIRYRPGIEKKRISAEMGSRILKEQHQDVEYEEHNPSADPTEHRQGEGILSRQTSERDLDHIAQSVDSNWELLAPHLLKENAMATVEQIKDDHRITRQRILQLLLIWRKQTAPKTTLSRLFYQMSQAGPSVNINWKSVAEKLDIGYKAVRAYTNVKRQHLWKSTVHSLKNGILPDQRSLNELCSVFGRQSKLVVFTCRKICEQIRMMDENILAAWATYTVEDQTNITFVIIVKRNIRLGKAMKYSYIKRVVNEYSLEAKDVLYSNKKALIDQNDLERLRASIYKNATELLKRHKFLSVISGSSVRSRNYGLDPLNAVDLVEQPCIVLYVHTKHYIPIDEEPFENQYDGVPVDVMEGEFVPYVLATEYHDNLRHSCQIGSSPDRLPNHQNICTGSLGCFIDHPEYNLCGLTCAHVLLFPWGMEEVENDERGTLRWPHFKPYDLVYQPAGSNNVIGQIVQVIYHKGGNESCGMEVALFQIDRRQPISGQFPTMRNSAGDAEMTFSTGNSCGFSHIGNDKAIKFGPVSDKTTGKFELETQTTCVKTINEYWDYDTFRIKLNNQLCVKATDTNGQPIPFAEEGDSGSLVFKTEENGELVCVGIVEGGTSYGATIVTPIKPILQKIGVQSIKRFDKEEVLGKLIGIENRLERLGNIENTLKRIDNIESRMEGFETKMDQIVQLLTRGQGGSS